MAIEAKVTGNVLESPTQRMVTVNGEQARITEVRVMSDVYRRQGDGLVQDDAKSSPVGITIWNENVGNRVMKVCRTGIRVVVSGELHLDRWEPNAEQVAAGKKSGAEMRMTANEVTLALNRIESIVMQAPRQERGDSTNGSSGNSGTGASAPSGVAGGADDSSASQ
jgi:single-stranded DNA-binding protein